MAEFSKEWLEREGYSLPSDFSILEEFTQLKEGESIPMICEGFGFTHIVNENNECHVVIKGKLIPYSLLIFDLGKS